MNLFDLFATLKFDNSDFKRGVQESKREAQGLSTSVSGSLKQAGTTIAQFGTNITNIGKTLSVVTVGVGALLGSAFSKAKDYIGTYESAMVTFSHSAQVGKQGAQALYDSLLDVAQHSAYAREHFFSAGQSLVAMGISADKTTKYVQAITDSVSKMGKSGTNIEDMAELFGKMSIKTHLYSLELNQLVTAGIPAWDILATHYHTNTEKIKEMVKEGLIPAKEGLDILTNAIEETNEQSEMFQYSAAGMANALKQGTLTGTLDSLNSSFRAFALSLLDLDPATESGRENIKALNATIAKFGEVLKSFGKTFGFVGDWISAGLKNITEFLGNLNDKLKNMPQSQAEAIAKTIAAIALAGPGLIVVGKLITGIGNTIKGISIITSGALHSSIVKIGTALAGLVPWLPIIIAACVAIASVAVAIKRNWETVVNFFKMFKFGELFASLKKVIDEFLSKLPELGDAFEAIGIILLVGLSPAITIITGLFRNAVIVFNGVVTAVTGMVDILGGLGKVIVGLFKGDKDKIQAGFKEIWDGCLEIVEGFIKTFGLLFDPTGTFMKLFDPAISSTIEFSNTVSEESKRAVQAYMDLDRAASIELDTLYWNSTQITEDTKNSICKKYDDMESYIVNKLNEQKTKSLEVLQDMVSESETLSEEEKQAIVSGAQKTYEESAKKVTDGNNRIKEIMQTASDEKREITQDEKDEIVRIQEDMKKESVKAISESKDEQIAILNDLKLNASKLSVEQCSEVVKQSAKQRDSTIDNAKAEYRDRLKQAQKLRDEGGEENEKLADKVEEEATRQYDSAVSKAQEIHNKVVEQAQAQAQEHGEVLDEETGEVKSKWQVMCDDITKWMSGLGGDISNGWNSIAATTAEAWDNMKSWVSSKAIDLKNDVATKFNQVKDKTIEIWGNIKQSIVSRMDDAREGIRKAIERIKELFNFKFSWPKIPLPQFRISPSGWKVGDLLLGSIPTLDISWRAKGGIFTRPTIFPTSHGLEGVGEAGAEAVLPIKLLKEYIVDAMAEGVREAQVSYGDSYSGRANADMVNALLSSLTENNQKEINIYIGGKKIASELYDPLMATMKKKEVYVGA